MKELLLAKIRNKNITVGVVGLGYVGLPLAVEKLKLVIKQSALMCKKKKLKWLMLVIIILVM